MTSRTLVSLMLVALPMTFLAAAQGAQDLDYEGMVFVNNQVRFRLKGQIREKEGFFYKSELYSDTRGQPVLKDDTVVRLEPLEIIRFDQVDYQTGRHNRILRSHPGYWLGFKKNAASDLRQQVIDEEGILIPETMTTPFLMMHLNQLLDDQKVCFKYLLPSRFSSIAFCLKNSGIQKVADRDYYVITLKPSSLLLRSFVSPCYFFVEREPPHRLIHFKGRLSPSDAEGNALYGSITVNYQEPPLQSNP